MKTSPFPYTDLVNATLILKDGSTLTGESFGAQISAAGEVVFNTSMVGYPESFTDPSYEGQILVLTYPLIGNYGIPEETSTKEKISRYFESECPHIKGLIVSENSKNFSHFGAKSSLEKWLKKYKIPAITGIDTRALTQKIRQHGTLLGKIVPEGKKEPDFYNPDLDKVVAKVSIKRPKIYKRGKKTVICVDCGMKNNIIRNFLDRNITVIRVPWNYDFTKEKIQGKKIKFDGIFLSNGPGDPATLKPLHEIVKKAFALKKPIFGICLGCQIMAISSGAKTYKLKFGHRAGNQPVQDTKTEHCYITSQNHGFAVDEKTLQKGWEIWLKNLNDETVEGIRHKTLPFFASQFHPEASPGPLDTTSFFDRFIEML